MFALWTNKYGMESDRYSNEYGKACLHYELYNAMDYILLPWLTFFTWKLAMFIPYQPTFRKFHSTIKSSWSFMEINKTSHLISFLLTILIQCCQSKVPIDSRMDSINFPSFKLINIDLYQSSHKLNMQNTWHA